MSYNGSMKYSATGGTGGANGSLSFKKQSPSRILGDYQMTMVNKAFKDFWEKAVMRNERKEEITVA